MSVRSEMFDRFREALHENGLMTSPTAGISGRKEKRGKPYYVTFGTARYMDGEMVVYGTSFIQFRVRGTPINNGYRNDNFVFQSEEDATAFIEAMGNGDREAALDVPTK